MACDRPLIAIKLGFDADTNKQRLVLKRPHYDWSINDYRERYGFDRVVLLPCGHCPSCLLAKRKEWMIRCTCEAKYHADNCFVTLTYDEDHCDGKLHKEHLQDFILKIRNRGFKVRYYACGEFGTRTNRPHYHAILFGFLPDDLVKSHDSDSGETIFTSDLVTSCWSYGLSVVQTFSPSAAGYVAGYTNKKVLDDRGWTMCSRRPGIGYQYFDDHWKEIYERDLIQENFSDTMKCSSVSRYYDKLAEAHDHIDMEVVKQERQDRANVLKSIEYFYHHYDFDEKMFDDYRFCSINKLKLLKRGF